MALAPITIAEWLRPWHSAGVRHLLAEHPVALQKEAVAVSAAFPCSGRMRPAVSMAQEQPADVVEPSCASCSEFAVKPAAADLNPAQWPPLWRSFFAKVRPAPIVWTYHELGLDLAGGGKTERGTLFRKLIADLRLPKGTSAFWPTASPAVPLDHAAAVPEDGGLEANGPLFWTGIALLKPKVVVVFGAKALLDMGLEVETFPLFQQRISEGKLLVHLPDMSLLLADETRLAPTLSLLRAVLQSCTVT